MPHLIHRSVVVLTALSSLMLARNLQAAPKISCPDPEFKFGIVESGLDVQATFTIRNDGDEPLVVSKVLPGCGCTTARIADNTIQPGKETTINATLSLKLQKGDLRKEVVIDSNDPAVPRTVIYIVGTAVYPFTLNPEKMFFGPVDAHAGESRTIDVTAPSP